MDAVSQEQEPQPEPEELPQGSVWARLREAREAQGMTIAEVARYLKLTPRQIDAMEAGDLSHLPEVTFARGFIRNYARLLKLDPQPLLAELEPPRETILPAQPAKLGSMPGPRAARFSALPAAAMCALLLGLICVAWYYNWFEPRDEQFLADVVSQSEPMSEVPLDAPTPVSVGGPLIASAPVAQASAPLPGNVPVLSSAPVAQSQAAVLASAPLAASAPVVQSSAPIAIVAAATTASSPALQPGQLRMVLSFEVEAWVEVKDAAGRIVFSRINQPGSTQEVLGTGPLSLVIGNAPGVKLVANGRLVDLMQYTKLNVARLTLP